MIILNFKMTSQDRHTAVEINWRIPQGSVLGLLLYNIFMNDIFIEKSEIFNFSDDNVLYSSGKNFSNIKKTILFMISKIFWSGLK